MIIDKEWVGKDFVWWIGRVESVQDQMEMGRTKVRIFGYHSQDTNKLPTSKLPWAYTIMPTISASHARHGFSASGLEPGSWVIGFFMDGKRGQIPAVFGTFHGLHANQSIPGPAGGSNPPGGGGPPGASNPPMFPGQQGGLSTGTNAGGSTFGGAATGPGAAGALGLNPKFNQASNLGMQPGGNGLTTIVTGSGARVTVNTIAAPQFRGFLGDMERSGYYINPTQTGGYNFRNISGTNTLSQHAYGNAVDINWNQNPHSHSGVNNMPANVGQLADKWGLSWGGYFNKPDTMHFEMSRFVDTSTVTPVGSTVPGGTPALPSPAAPGSFRAAQEELGAGAPYHGTQLDSQPETSHTIGYPTDTDKKTALEEQQNSKRECDIETAADGSAWCEPESKDVGTYPNVHTWQSKDGKTKIEMDATPGAERIKLYHKTGTYTEIDNAGNIVHKAQGDSLTIARKNARVAAKNDITMTSQGDTRILATKEMAIESKGRLQTVAGGNWDITAEGSVAIRATEDLVLEGKSIKMVSSSGAIDMRSKGDMNIESHGEMNVQSTAGMIFDSGDRIVQNAKNDMFHNAGGTIKTEAKGDFSMKSEANIKVEGAEYHNKSPKAIFDKGDFNELFASGINWNATGSPAAWAPVGPPPPSSGAADLGSPEEADSAKEETTKYANFNRQRNRHFGSAGNAVAAHANANPGPTTGKQNVSRNHDGELVGSPYLKTSDVSESDNMQALGLQAPATDNPVLNNVLRGENFADSAGDKTAETAGKGVPTLMSQGRESQLGGNYAANSPALREAARVTETGRLGVAAAAAQAAASGAGGAAGQPIQNANLAGLNPNQQSWMDFAMRPVANGGLGLNRLQASGLVGAMMGESGIGLNPAAINPSSGASGAFQWLGSRKTALQNFANARGTHWSDTATQQQFLRSEFLGSERAAFNRLSSASTLQQAVFGASSSLRWANWQNSYWNTRGGFASSVFNETFPEPQYPNAQNYGGGSYVRNILQTDRAAKVLGQQHGHTAVASMTGLYNQTPTSWAMTAEAGKLSLPVNQLIKEGPGQAGWREFVSKHRGTVSNPLLSPIEHYEAWLHSYFRPYIALGSAMWRPKGGLSPSFDPSAIIQNILGTIGGGLDNGNNNSGLPAAASSALESATNIEGVFNAMKAHDLINEVGLASDDIDLDADMFAPDGGF